MDDPASLYKQTYEWVHLLVSQIVFSFQRFRHLAFSLDLVHKIQILWVIILLKLAKSQRVFSFQTDIQKRSLSVNLQWFCCFFFEGQADRYTFWNLALICTLNNISAFPMPQTKFKCDFNHIWFSKTSFLHFFIQYVLLFSNTKFCLVSFFYVIWEIT